MNIKLLLGEGRQTQARRITVAAILFAFAAFVFVAVVFRDSLLGQLFFRMTSDVFMDYFNCLYVVANRDPYSFITMYPPLAELIFYLFSKTISYEMLFCTPPLREEQAPMMSFLLFIAIPIVIMAWALADYLKIAKPMNRVVILAFFVTTPFLWMLERGNIIIYSLAGIMIFICYYDSDKRWLRELALLGLAFSAGVKLYPAILGLILIRDKRWKDAIRCALYGVFFIFAPFLAFGGLKSLLSMINSLKYNADVLANDGNSYKVNYSYIFNMIGRVWLGRSEEFGWAQTAAYILSALLIVAAFLIGKKWKSILFLTLVMIGFPSFSYTYCLVFILAPFLMFIAGKEKDLRPTDMIYMLMFIAILAPFPITIGDITTISDVNINTQVIGISILIITGWGFIDAILDTAARFRDRDKPKAEVKA
ncbi:MAG: DUF2029 domain-containing protein [Clostridiales bacterium]|nr:DUF2029 domain-containing protein [Clostridiales bacterium]